MSENCYLCRGTELALLSNRGRGNIPLINKVCKSCGLAQRIPMPEPEEVKGYYAQGSFMDENQDRNYPRLFRRQRQASLVRAKFLKKCLVANGGYKDSLRILEIGSHIGSFLSVAGEVFHGAEIFGIEPDAGTAEFSESVSGAKIYNATLEDVVASEKKKFDVICSFAVLEHVYNPLDHLMKAKELLKPEGALHIEVPNMHSHSTGWPFWYDWYMKEHLFHFSVPTITRLMGQAGFVVKDIYDVKTLRIFAIPSEKVPSEVLGARDDYVDVLESHREFKRQHLKEQFKSPKKFLKLLLFLVLGHNMAFALIKFIKEL